MEKEYAKKILIANEIDIKKGIIKYSGKLYEKRDWYAFTSKYIKNIMDGKQINYSHKTPRLDIIYASFLMNVSEFAKNGVIFPCALFLLISLISFQVGFLFYSGVNFGLGGNLGNLAVVMIFLGGIFFIFALLKIILAFTLQNKCFLGQFNLLQRYVYISGKKYREICVTLEEEIAKKTYRFEPFLTERLKIEEFKSDNYVDLYEMLSSERVVKYLFSKKMETYDEAFLKTQQILSNYQRKGAFLLAIKLKENSKVIGYIGLSKMDLSLHTCQVVYALNENYFGKGYMTEALKAFIYELKQRNYKLILAGHVQENEKSGNVLIKCGFERYDKKDYDYNYQGKMMKIVSYKLEFEEKEKKTDDEEVLNEEE